ncbi:MAG: hypothetical protein LUF00_11390 [Lachnospiraceae bacterium]|nr:hypothetical protein [Lachnospiraceae bacterium]
MAKAKPETQIKRYESTAAHYERKGKREWAYYKNAQNSDDERSHYLNSQTAFNKAKINKEKAEKMRKDNEL